MIRRVARASVGLLMAAAAIAAVGGAWGWRELHRPWAGWSGTEVIVQLPRGLDAGSVLERLGRAGVVRRPWLVRAWLTARRAGADLKAGEYRFDEPASPLEVLARLQRGDVVLHEITLPEGLRLEEIAERIARAELGDLASLLSAFRDPALIADLDPRAPDLEGYLFPDTYRLPKGRPAAFVARTLTRRFHEVTGPGYPDRASEVGLDLRGAVTLASMIEKETSVAEERWRISRVFHNRLDLGMKLQCDPTVIYALHRAGRSVDRLARGDLELDSPWNTYRVEGLPPGPICNPGRASLDAAVRPAEGDELYFVASPEGGHAFSTDLRSHLKAVRNWRRHQRSPE